MSVSKVTWAVIQSKMDQVMACGVPSLDTYAHVCTAVGYNQGTYHGWRTAGKAPEVALWAFSHLLYTLSCDDGSASSFTQQEVKEILLLAVKNEQIDLVLTCAQILSE